MKKITISKRITFEAAHHLLNYEGPCSTNHGHSWGLTVTISASEFIIGLNNGMILDYKILKSIIQDVILDKLDHKDINLLDFPFNPTSENLSVWIFDQLKNHLSENYPGIHLESISLKETENSECIVEEIQWL